METSVPSHALGAQQVPTSGREEWLASICSRLEVRDEFEHLIVQLVHTTWKTQTRTNTSNKCGCRSGKTCWRPKRSDNAINHCLESFFSRDSTSTLTEKFLIMGSQYILAAWPSGGYASTQENTGYTSPRISSSLLACAPCASYRRTW